MDEVKSISSMYQSLLPVCENIKNVALGFDATNELPYRSHIFQYISFGNSSGLLQSNNRVQIARDAHAKNEEFREYYMGSLNNVDKHLKTLKQ